MWLGWRGKDSLDVSVARIAKSDIDRRDADRSAGRVIPKPQDLALGEIKSFNLAILHIDIDNYKPLVEKLEMAQASRLLSSFLTEMTYLVKDYEGDLESYSGDRVTALFGAGQEKTTAVSNCVNCALSMITVVKYAISPFLNQKGLPSFRCAVGMDYGPTWVERIGIRNENQLALIGPTVSIAAQLQELAKANQILLGEDIYRGLSTNDQGLCSEMTATNWTWTRGEGQQKRPYRFYLFRAQWPNFPLAD